MNDTKMEFLGIRLDGIKVGRLIEELSRFDPDLDVRVGNSLEESPTDVHMISNQAGGVEIRGM